MDEIRFYRANEKPYGVFSNLYRRPIVFEGCEFPTAEHAYQYGKPRDIRTREWLMAAPTPAILAKSAHQLTCLWEVAPGWSKIKIVRMRAVLLAKFSQHADLRDLLLGTGDARLVESGTIADAAGRFWGEVNGCGKNMLGNLLMDVRKELRGVSVTGGVNPQRVVDVVGKEAGR